MNPEENKEVRNEIKTLRTYKGDIEDAISENKTSSTTILVAEQEKRGFAPLPSEESGQVKNRNKIIIIGGGVLLFLGLFIVGGVYYLKSESVVIIERKIKTPIGFSLEKTLLVASSTKEQLRKQILSEKNSFSMPKNSVLYINTVDPNGYSTSPSNFLSIITTKTPSTLGRSVGDEYMLGAYASGTNEPFIIFTTNDFPTSYSGMLSWEKTMASDVGWLFGINEQDMSAKFLDEESQNRDLRILKNNNGKIILLYTIVDKDAIIITSSQNILNALIEKYIINKQIR
ncbi:MAG: hypothetical protein WAX85_01765 [Minisyncoccia bacterium]